MKRKDFIVKENGSDREVLLSVKSPSYEELEEADQIYAAKVASVIRESGKKKPLLRSEVDTFLRATNVWTKEDEDKISQLQKDINTLLDKLRKGGEKLSSGRQICLDISDKRRQMVEISRKRQIFDDTTIESIAENERNDYLVYVSTVYAESGERYWCSFDDMKNDKLSDAFNQAYVKTMEIVYGVNVEFEKRLPENRWLKKYGFVDDELNYIDRKTGERVDRSGKLVKELEEAVQKQIDNLQGEVEEEAPFIDDETGAPVEVK